MTEAATNQLRNLGVDTLRRHLQRLQIERTTLRTPISARSVRERTLLSYAQERLWFLEQLGQAGTAYNIPLALRL